MVWIVVIALLVGIFGTESGKLICGVGIVALGLLLIAWITGFAFLITLAKVCAIIIIVIVVVSLLGVIFGG